MAQFIANCAILFIAGVLTRDANLLAAVKFIGLSKIKISLSQITHEWAQVRQT